MAIPSGRDAHGLANPGGMLNRPPDCLKRPSSHPQVPINSSSAATRDVSYGCHQSAAGESVRLHQDMVLHVADEAGAHFGIPRERRLLVGFSQSVALNYRFVASHPAAVRGVIGICGGLPGDWEEGAYQPVTAAVLHIARRGDEYYSPSATEHYGERLRRRAADVEFHLIDGGHKMPSSCSGIVVPWLRRILK